METRASTHNGRAGKHGAYSARHNDRQFDTSTTDHIDPTLTPQNKNIRFGGSYDVSSNEDHELAFYAEHFGASLARKNAGYKEKGKPGQIKTMEQYYRSVKSCPEETLYTAGTDVEPQLLWQVYREHQAWKAVTYPQCQTLDAALHVDEPNAMPHVHERSVWIGHDAHGMEVVGQAKALAEMGVLPPDPEKKYGKYNNAKQTYTQICRAHFIEVCRQHGLEIITTPLPADKVGLELTEYQIQHAQQRAAVAENSVNQLTKELVALYETKNAAKEKADEAVETAARASRAAEEAKKAAAAAQKEYDGIHAALAAVAPPEEIQSVEASRTLGGKWKLSDEDYNRYKTAALATSAAVAERDAARKELRNAQAHIAQLQSQIPSTAERLREAKEKQDMMQQIRQKDAQIERLKEQIGKLMGCAVPLWERLVETLRRLFWRTECWTFREAEQTSRKLPMCQNVYRDCVAARPLIAVLEETAGGEANLLGGILIAKGMDNAQVDQIVQQHCHDEDPFDPYEQHRSQDDEWDMEF